MNSFISSFDRIRKIRVVPVHPWPRVLSVAVLAALLVLVGWEINVRASGYVPSIKDTPGLWAIWRDRLKAHDRDVIVIVGASRIRFGLEHDSISEAFGGLPVVNLSMNGSVARPVLHNLAQDPGFRGIVVCDYVPNLFWMPGGPLLDSTNEWIEAWPKRTPSARSGQWLAIGLESLIAFLNEDLTLSQLLSTHLPLADREGLAVPPAYPPFIATNQLDRRHHMWSKLENDVEFQQRVQEIWRGLFSMAQRLPPDLLAKMRAEVVADVQAIRSRGGDVIFVRYPSTGWLRDQERETAPREEYWEPLLAEANAIGIHFEDHPELAGYDCPEWSHLTAADAASFSQSLARIIKKQWKGRTPPAPAP